MCPQRPRLCRENRTVVNERRTACGKIQCRPAGIRNRRRGADRKITAFINCEGTGESAENGGSERDSTVLTLPEFIYSTYNSLLESGWRMDEIDRMDMPGFLKIRAWNAKQEQKKKEPRQRYIDEVWSGLKP